jgi:hypothetical protein
MSVVTDHPAGREANSDASRCECAGIGTFARFLGLVGRTTQAQEDLVNFKGAANLHQSDDRWHHLTALSARQIGSVNARQGGERGLGDVTPGSQPANQPADFLSNCRLCLRAEGNKRLWKLDFEEGDA